MTKRNFLRGGLAAAALLASGLPGLAQDVTLRMHQFLPPQANVPKHILIPWAEKVTAESGGKMKVEVFSAMALGGTPPQLIDQARDGVVDIVWTLPGYTPGRFPRVEVFELPFMMTNAEAASRAYWDIYSSDMQDDFPGLKILGAWVHGPGIIHSKSRAISQVRDMEGLKVRGPTRVINGMLDAVGATPVGMPVPAIPEALSKGVIDGTVIPWEVTPALKIAELAKFHTEFGGDKALYTATFVLAMNQGSYDRLSDEMKAVIDANSGMQFSADAGRIMQEYDAPGREIATAAGNTITIVEGDALTEWQEVGTDVTANWIEEMDAIGIDGQDLVDRASALIADYTQ